MARGDVHWFTAYALNADGNATVTTNLTTDAIKLAFIGNGTTLSANLARPTWGAGGSTNLSSFEVGTGSVYIAGGPTLSSVTWAISNNTVALGAAHVTVAQDVAGFSTAYWAVGYDNTQNSKDALFFVDLGGPVGISAGALTITWAGNLVVNRVIS